MTDTTAPVSVLLVDDQDLVRTGFRIILDTAPDVRVVGEACDGLEAVDLVRRLRPDVVVMDIEMPVLDGLEATRRILAQSPGGGPAVLVLTTFGRDDYVFRALQAGASGFLLKTATPEDLIEAIAVVHRGDALLSPQLTRAVVERAVGDPGTTRVVVPSPALATLTEREREVLDRLASGASNAEIARRLFLGEATVKTHVSNVLGKLGLRDRTAAVVFAYENGVAVPGGPAT
ncbi:MULTISPECIES: response regulator transcription factor [unclassified Frigoribacterium]|uniref:response regulator n=1 Tax=unclassified Frigoribacterium TaxID=2627005 RepID=UPI0015678272|nr:MULTISPECIES: response regulator transcription factor [unclassified Frigoribacterium]NQW85880.1 response regulator transcription factor [Frigoribacterium sp. VKM Ac-2860]NQX07212.1 response regulator transcription factor [Frigoribacterium sp. VKM Ac-2859]